MLEIESCVQFLRYMFKYLNVCFDNPSGIFFIIDVLLA